MSKTMTVPRSRVRVIEMGGPAPDARDPDDRDESPGECQVMGERGSLVLVCYRPAWHMPPVHWDGNKELAWYDSEWDTHRFYPHPNLGNHETSTLG